MNVDGILRLSSVETAAQSDEPNDDDVDVQEDIYKPEISKSPERTGNSQSL